MDGGTRPAIPGYFARTSCGTGLPSRIKRLVSLSNALFSCRCKLAISDAWLYRPRDALCNLLSVASLRATSSSQVCGIASAPSSAAAARAGRTGLAKRLPLAARPIPPAPGISAPIYKGMSTMLRFRNSSGERPKGVSPGAVPGKGPGWRIPSATAAMPRSKRPVGLPFGNPGGNPMSLNGEERFTIGWRSAGGGSDRPCFHA